MSTKRELRKWARESLVGIENTIIPSFTADLQELDEDGIRHDVRRSIEHGFFSCLAPTETGLTLAEAKRFVSIVCDEAKGRINVSTTLLRDSWAEQHAMLEHAGTAGVHTILLGYPPNWYPRDVEQIFAKSRELCEATELAVVLYPSPHFNFERFHPSGFPLEIMARLVAACPNAVAATIGDLALLSECQRAFGREILLNCPVERFQPTCVLELGLQWMGAGCYEVFQSPAKPLLVEYFNLLLAAKREGDDRKAQQAMDIYWRLTPARVTFDQQFKPMLGTYHWAQQKFYQWCVGGNGGLTRQPSMKLHQHEMEATRMAYRMIGIQPAMDDPSFFMGRAAWARQQAG